MSTITRTTEQVPAQRRSRRRRILTWIALSLVGLILVAYAGIGWYVSGEVIDGMSATAEPVTYDTDIISVEGDRVAIGTPDEATVALDRDAVMGLRWEGGWAIGRPAESFTETIETRRFTLVQGTELPTGVDVAAFDSLVFPGDPSSLAIPFQNIVVAGPGGELPAWFIPGDRTIWLIAVHGLAAGRRDTLRLLDATQGTGYPTLVPSYRNDDGAPGTDRGLGMMGQNEREDLAAAVDYARNQGATGVVLYGMSMGGGIVLSYLMNTDDPGFVRGAVLESPMADFRQLIDIRSGEALPIGGWIGDSMLAVGRMFVWMRTGLDFDEVDYVDRSDELNTPILLMHGTDDPKVPFAVGQALADARPDLIDFRPIADAAHVRAWNEDPVTFRSMVVGFMEQVG
jgi:alpha-beta hydrolase superfamily lysophospholipase